MPAGPAPTIASRSLVIWVLSCRVSGCASTAAGAGGAVSAGAVGDGLCESRERFADGTVGDRGERLDRLARPRVGEVERRACRLVLAEGRERVVEDRGVGAV